MQLKENWVYPYIHENELSNTDSGEKTKGDSDTSLMTNLGDNTRVSQVETRSREREAFISARSQLKSPHVLPPQKLGLMREKRNPEIRTVPDE